MENIYDKVTCKICGKNFSGETANLQAEKCEHAHEKVVISLWDFELPGLINFFSTNDRALLPKDFLRKLRNLQGRVLRG
jgi:hypothetical protein